MSTCEHSWARALISIVPRHYEWSLHHEYGAMALALKSENNNKTCIAATVAHGLLVALPPPSGCEGSYLRACCRLPPCCCCWTCWTCCLACLRSSRLHCRSAPTMVGICGKSPNSDFLGQNGQKKVCIYPKKSEFYHFPFVQHLFYINKLFQQLYLQQIGTQSSFNHVWLYVLLSKQACFSN